MEWLVEMMAGIVGDRRVGEIYYHRPGCSEESLALRLTFGLPLSRLGRADASIALLSLLHRLRHGSDGFGQLLLTHHAVRLVESLAKSVITVVALCKSYVQLLLAQVVIGYGWRFCYHHLIVNILDNHASA